MAVKQAMPGGPAGESLPAGPARGAPPGRALRKLWPFGGLILLAGRPARAQPGESLPGGAIRRACRRAQPGRARQGEDPARLPAGLGEPAGGPLLEINNSQVAISPQVGAPFGWVGRCPFYYTSSLWGLVLSTCSGVGAAARCLSP